MDESRTAPRYAFGVEQSIAKIAGDRMPSLEAFRPVRCADISRTGFAFYQATRPDYEDLIVALGIPPDHIYATARIVHVKLIEICGGLAFRVGCRFTGRATYCDVSQTFVRAGVVGEAFDAITANGCGEARG